MVKEVAKAGRGSYSFVQESSDNLKGKVISALRKAVEPSLKGCSFLYSSKNTVLAAPDNGQIGEAFRNDIVTQYLILNAREFEELKLNFHCDEDPVTK